MKIPLCKAYLGEEELNAVKEVLESGRLVHGLKTREFELQFADYIGTKYAVSLNSCASALHAAILANKLNGEIILPSLTFPASANAIVNAGCIPVYADIEEDSFTIDPDKIKEKITENTVGIMPVHYAGQSADMGRIMKIAEANDLKVIEDSAEAIGSTFNGKKTGSFSTGCFSFYPTKNMTTGEGGMVTTNEEEIRDAVKTISGHGIASRLYDREKQEKPWLRKAILPGYNYRINEIQAAIGLVQTKKLNEMNKKRQDNAHYLTNQLWDINEIITPKTLPGRNHVYQMYIIKVKNIDRNSFVKFLIESGIEASVHFNPPLHEKGNYTQKYSKGNLPITEDTCKKIVTLPMFPELNKEQMDYIVSKIKQFIKKYENN